MGEKSVILHDLEHGKRGRPRKSYEKKKTAKKAAFLKRFINRTTTTGWTPEALPKSQALPSNRRWSC